MASALTKSPRTWLAFLFVCCSVWPAVTTAEWREVDVSKTYRLHTARVIDGKVYIGGTKASLKAGPQAQETSVILTLDGRGLTPVYDGPFVGHFWAIKGSRSAIYAVADDAILRFDGSTWKNIATPAVENLKFRFVVERDGDAYFLNERGDIFQFDGAAWIRVNVPPQGVVRMVWSDETGTPYLLVALVTYSAGGATSMTTGLAVFRFSGTALEAIPFKVVGNRARVEAATKVQASVVANDRFLREYSEQWKQAFTRGRVLAYLSPAYLVLEGGAIVPLRVEPDIALDELGAADSRGRVANTPRTASGQFITVANEQILRDAAPYPTADWVLVSDDGLRWTKLTEIYAADGRPGSDHVIQVLPDGQVVVIAGDRFYQYDGRGNILDAPRKPAARPIPEKPVLVKPAPVKPVPAKPAPAKPAAPPKGGQTRPPAEIEELCF